MGRVEGSLVVCGHCGLAHRWQPLLEAVAGALHALRRRPRPRPPARRSSGVLALTLAAAAAYLIAVSTPLMSLSLRGGAETATLPQAIAIAWQDGQQLIAIVAAITALLAPALPSSACASTCSSRSPPAASRRASPGASACCTRPRAGTWSRCSRSASCCRWCASPAWPTRRRGPGLFALGALTMLFAAIESAGLKHLWWHVAMSAGGRRRRRRLPRLRELRPGVASTSRGDDPALRPAVPALRPRPARDQAVRAAAHLGLRRRRRDPLRPRQHLAGDGHDVGAAARRAHAARRHPRALARRLVGAGDHRLHRQHRRAGAEDRRPRPARLDRALEAAAGAASSGRGCTG